MYACIIYCNVHVVEIDGFNGCSISPVNGIVRHKHLRRLYDRPSIWKTGGNGRMLVRTTRVSSASLTASASNTLWASGSWSAVLRREMHDASRLQVRKPCTMTTAARTSSLASSCTQNPPPFLSNVDSTVRIISRMRTRHCSFCVQCAQTSKIIFPSQALCHGNSIRPSVSHSCTASTRLTSKIKYTLWVKKNWATFLRPITLEILNRSLPNLAQIKVSSFWTSCQRLFKSTLENSGAI